MLVAWMPVQQLDDYDPSPLTEDVMEKDLDRKQCCKPE